MSTILLFLLFLFVSASRSVCFSQTLKGIILDADTKEPVVGVNVYLNSTTLGDATDTQGRFSINVDHPIYTQLIISYIGYEKVIIENPFTFLPDTVFLKETEIKLEEVTVKGKPTFSEKQKMKAFREQFLGVTMAGRSCKIHNEKVIRLFFDPETNKLHGYSDVPLMIENKYLGYKILCDLLEFTLVLKNNKSLEAKNIDSVSIICTASFEDMRPDEYYTSQKRVQVYNTSKNRFFCFLLEENEKSKEDHKLLYSKKPPMIKKPLKSNIFLFKRLHSNVTLNDTCHYSRWFNITDDIEERSLKSVKLNPEETDSMGRTLIAVAIAEFTDRQTETNFQHQLILTNDRYRTTYLSFFHFLTDTFSIDSYGNTTLVKDLFITGDMGYYKVGNQLPLNYAPLKN